MNPWGNSKTDKLLKWVNTVYQPRVQAFPLEEFIKQITPFGGRTHSRSRNYWAFETLEARAFWEEEVEKRFGLLTISASNVYEVGSPIAGYFRIAYQPDLIYALTLGKNNALKKQLIDLRRKDKKYGQRRKA
jgi:hypothetical protein